MSPLDSITCSIRSGRLKPSVCSFMFSINDTKLDRAAPALPDGGKEHVACQSDVPLCLDISCIDSSVRFPIPLVGKLTTLRNAPSSLGLAISLR